MLWTIPIQDETKPVNFIVHQPSGDTVPTSRDPGGDRAFTPAAHPEIWLKGGDATVYFTDPG
jgi:alpha-amylase